MQGRGEPDGSRRCGGLAIGAGGHTACLVGGPGLGEAHRGDAHGGHIPEVVENGKTGILVRLRDSDALAQAIVALLKDEEKRHRMGMLGKERVLSRFTAQRSVAQLETLYQSLLQAKGMRLLT